MKTIQLTKGYEALVDDEDYEKINQYKWYAKVKLNNVYAERSWELNGEKFHQKMHRFILNLTDKKVHCDHINHNGLDNQKLNLRKCTSHQNRLNSRKVNGSSSKYRGVSVTTYKYKNSISFRWLAKLKLKQNMTSKLFPYTEDGEILAAKFYDEKAKELFGEFANLNFKDANNT